MSDRLLSGLVHDLRGRATTFEGLARLLAEDDGELDGFRRHLATEIARLEVVVELLRLLRGGGNPDPEPLSLAEALPELLDLWCRASGQPLPVEPDHDGEAPPVRVAWSAFRKAFLILLDEADLRAKAAGAGAVRLELRAQGAVALLRLTWNGAARAQGAGEAGRGRFRALAKLFGAVGGDLVDVEGEPRMEVRFPGLGGGA